MIGTLAQTLSQSADFEWRYWINLCVAVFATIMLPVILFVLKLIMDRLRKGDETFQNLSTITTQLKVQREESQKTLDEIKTDVKKLTDKTHDAQLEELGSLGKFRADIEREFVRKKELDQLRSDMSQQHAEAMRAIAGLRTGH